MDTVELAFDVYQCEDPCPDLNPIVMLHGIGSCKFMYRDLARDLCQATQRKVFCLDLRNHGESPSTDNMKSDLMIEDVKRFISEQNLTKIDFVSHSYSNMISYLIALEKPYSVDKLLMIDGPPFFELTEKLIKELVDPQYHFQKRLMKTLDNNMSLKDAKSKFISFGKMSNKVQEIFCYVAAYYLTKKSGKFQWKTNFDFMMDQLARGQFSIKPRGSSDKEILIIRCGNSVTVTDSKFEAVLKHNPNAKLMTLEDTTHLLMFEEKEKFIQAAKEFLHVSD